MSKPPRFADPSDIVSTSRTFFVTTNTSRGKRLLQSDRNANLLIDVLRTNVAAKKFQIHDFVIMPEHVHLLMSVEDATTIEKAVQLIKGGFSYRLKKEFAYVGEIWQRGFSDVRVRDRESFLEHREYIAQNPVKAGIVDSAENFPFSFNNLARQKAAGAKARSEADAYGTTEVVPFHESNTTNPHVGADSSVDKSLLRIRDEQLIVPSDTELDPHGRRQFR
jgi:putative transposase